MRRRDAQAIWTFVITALGLTALIFLLTKNILASLAVCGAYSTFILTRPRARRIRSRLRGDADWSNYFER